MRPIRGITSNIVTAMVHPETWEYFYFDLGASRSFQVEMQRTSRQGDPDIYIQLEFLPTRNIFSDICKCESPWACPCQEVSFDEDEVSPPVRVLRSFGPVSGRVFVGVTGYCCNKAEFTLRVQLTGVENAPAPSAPAPLSPEPPAPAVAVTPAVEEPPLLATTPVPIPKPIADTVLMPPASSHVVSMMLGLRLTRADFFEKRGAFRDALASAANVAPDAVEITLQEVTGRRDSELRVEAKIFAKDQRAAAGIVNTHTHTLAHTHTHKHARTHAHTHTHTRKHR
jgi:hypothetical protein